MTNRDEVRFVYSQQQIAEDTSINARVGRTFVPGQVSVGNTRMQYSKIILRDELNKMTSVYPDTKVVAEGVLGNFKYTKVDEGFIK